MNKTDSRPKHSDNYPFAARLQNLGTSSLKLAAAGSQVDCLDLASGAPLFSTPEIMKQAAIKAIAGDQNQYGNPWGDQILRECIANQYSSDTGLELDPNKHVTVTNGSSSALAAVLISFVNPGDEVIVFTPCYESYLSAIKLAGGVIKLVELNTEDWTIRHDRLENAFSAKTKAVILNTPHNPTGQVFTSEQIAYILDLCEEHQSLLVSDEIYANLVFEGNRHFSPLASPGVDFDQVIVINGLSKAYNVSGWRIGYVLASERNMEAIRLVHSGFGLSAPTPLQIAARMAFIREESTEAATSSSKYYRDNLQLLYAAITKSGMKAVRPKGGTFVFADASSLATDGISAKEALLQKTGILTISGEPFFPSQNKLGSQYLRFCFARDISVIQKACERLAKLQS